MQLARSFMWKHCDLTTKVQVCLPSVTSSCHWLCLRVKVVTASHFLICCDSKDTECLFYHRVTENCVLHWCLFSNLSCGLQSITAIASPLGLEFLVFHLILASCWCHICLCFCSSNSNSCSDAHFPWRECGLYGIRCKNHNERIERYGENISQFVSPVVCNVCVHIL